jgi:hypothetical protein
VVALPVRPDDPVSRVEDWVDAWAQTAAEQLMTAGTAAIATSRGTIRATLRRPSWPGAGWLETSSSDLAGS